MVGAPYVLFIGLPIIGALAYWRWFYYKQPVYLYSSLAPFKNEEPAGRFKCIFLYILRIGTLVALCFALARLRKPDHKTQLPVEGVDILLVLDISGSMTIFDDLQDQRMRIDVARNEALKFIDRRVNDPIGLVIFSGVAISRCPLTLDKPILKDFLLQTDTKTISAQGTVLSRAILTAANRLKKSLAKSKIMIVLTDGEPTPNDTNPQISIDLAKKLGIKIYTIGIGSERGGWINDPYYGLAQVQGAPLNEPLLRKFALDTGGKFFRARNPADMEEIYNTIDRLEKSEAQTPLFARYYEYFMFFLWLAFFLLMGEILLTSLWWLRL